jgi:hypothetical protein
MSNVTNNLDEEELRKGIEASLAHLNNAQALPREVNPKQREKDITGVRQTEIQRLEDEKLLKNLGCRRNPDRTNRANHVEIAKDDAANEDEPLIVTEYHNGQRVRIAYQVITDDILYEYLLNHQDLTVLEVIDGNIREELRSYTRDENTGEVFCEVAVSIGKAKVQGPDSGRLRFWVQCDENGVSPVEHNEPQPIFANFATHYEVYVDFINPHDEAMHKFVLRLRDVYALQNDQAKNDENAKAFRTIGWHSKYVSEKEHGVLWINSEGPLLDPDEASDSNFDSDDDRKESAKLKRERQKYKELKAKRKLRKTKKQHKGGKGGVEGDVAIEKVADRPIAERVIAPVVKKAGDVPVVGKEIRQPVRRVKLIDLVAEAPAPVNLNKAAFAARVQAEEMVPVEVEEDIQVINDGNGEEDNQMALAEQPQLDHEQLKRTVIQSLIERYREPIKALVMSNYDKELEIMLENALQDKLKEYYGLIDFGRDEAIKSICHKFLRSPIFMSKSNTIIVESLRREYFEEFREEAYQKILAAEGDAIRHEIRQKFDLEALKEKMDLDDREYEKRERAQEQDVEAEKRSAEAKRQRLQDATKDLDEQDQDFIGSLLDK